MVITRFAPSPSGNIHVGNMRSAIINYLYTVNRSGECILRIDNTNAGKSSKIYIDQINKICKWIGIDFNRFYEQDSRANIYDVFIKELIAIGLVYPCKSSNEYIEMVKTAKSAKKNAPVFKYDDEKNYISNEQDSKYFRYRLNNRVITWNDSIRGQCGYNLANVSDPVILRSDGQITYSLASVIDDLTMGVSNIIRGEDHIVNTAIQIDMFQSILSVWDSCLNKLKPSECFSKIAIMPEFAHLPLMVIGEGKKVSKRNNDISIHNLREMGIVPIAIMNYLCSIGTRNTTSYLSIEELSKNFSLSDYGKSLCKFDLDVLIKINSNIIHGLKTSAIYEYISGSWFNSGVNEEVKFIVEKVVDIGQLEFEQFWSIVKGNIEKLMDLKEWLNICYDRNFDVIDIEFFKNEFINKSDLVFLYEDLLNLLNDSSSNLEEPFKNFRKNCHLKGKDFFMPVRYAFTGNVHGPNMLEFIEFVDRDILISRVKKILDCLK